MAADPSEPPAGAAPRAALRQLGRLYGAAAAGAPPPLSLSGLAAELGAEVAPPPSEAVILVVGDPGSGKSAFVNALAQETALAVPSAASAGPRPPVEWVRSAAAPVGAVPRLLAEAAAACPEALPAGLLAACCAVRSASPRLDAVEIVEATAPGEPESAAAVAWLAARADVVVCLLDSQRQPAVSSELLAWLKAHALTEARAKAEAAAGLTQSSVQFVLSKADRVPRESDRVRLVAKASKLLAERLGRGFEILPVAAGDLLALLDGVDGGGGPGAGGVESLEVDGCVFQLAEPSQEAPGDAKKLGAGALRALSAAQACAARHVGDGLANLRTDCDALSRALEAELARARDQVKAASAAPIRASLLKVAAAMVITAALLPFVLEDDIEQWVKQACSAGAGALAVLLALLALVLPAGAAATKGGAPSALSPEDARCRVGALQEKQRFLRLAARQHARWAGGAPSEAAAGSELAGAGPRGAAGEPTARRRAAAAAH